MFDSERGPIGHWRGTSGSFEALGADDIWFGADGTGRLVSHSVLLGDSMTVFRWRPVAPGAIEITVTTEDGEAQEPQPEVVRYGVTRTTSDVATTSSLVEVDSTGFWRLLDPITLVDDGKITSRQP